MTFSTTTLRRILCCTISCLLFTFEASSQADRFDSATLMVNFPNSPVSAILLYYEQLVGKKIIRDGNLDAGTISIVTDSKLTRKEAIQFIDSALLLNGYAILPVDDSTLKIINYTGGKSLRAQELPVISDPLSIPQSEQVINYVMKLDHISPSEAIDTFSNIVSLNAYGAMTALDKSNSIVITESTSVIRMLLKFKDFVDTSPEHVIHEFVKLERADAERVAEIVTGILDQQLNNGGSGSGTVKVSISTEKPNPTQPTGIQGPKGDEPLRVSISAYRRTNSILVIAPPGDFAFIEGLIKSFDEPSNGINFLKRKLRYVSVLDYMPSFYNALARGADMSHDENSPGSVPGGPNGGQNAGTPQPNSGADGASFGGGGGGSAAARNLLGSPDDIGTPVTYTVGNTLLIGDPQTNSLVVSGSPENIVVITELIDQIDIQPMQVYLSTIIGQLTIGDDTNYSLNALHSLATRNTPSNRLSGASSVFNGPDILPTLTGLNVPGALPTAFQGMSLYGKFAWGGNNAALDSMLRLFAMETKFKILSRPSIYAQNNVKATISSGQRIAIPTSTLTSGIGFNDGLGGAITSNIEFRDVVLKLEVIPLINSDHQVTLKIAQVNDNVVGSQIISGNEIPTLSTQELITTITLNSGEIMVLGGLITERADQTVTGLPGIRRIPILGKVLGSKTNHLSREETLIFIQPHIMNGCSETSNDLEKCRNSVLEGAMKFADPHPPICGKVDCSGCPECRALPVGTESIQAQPVFEKKGIFRFGSGGSRRQ